MRGSWQTRRASRGSARRTGSRRLAAGAILATCFALPSASRADAPPPSAPLAAQPVASSPLDALGSDVVEAFTGVNLLYYGGAVAATGVMAFGGVDQAIRVGVQEHLVAPAYGTAALYAGYVVPLTAAPAVWIVGLWTGDRVVTGAGSAALQALGVTLLTTGVLKIGVGRAFPNDGGDPSAPDRLEHPEHARTFRPFQTFWPLPAWPSGHTAGTISVAAALTAYYPGEWWIPAVGYPLALGIGFGMIVGDYHWASDVVAGALLGHAIGYSVGRAFRRRVRGEPAAGLDVQVLPLVAPGTAGLAAAGAF